MNIIKFMLKKYFEIWEGFEAYRNRRIAIAVDRMNEDLRTKVIYIQGEVSTYAKKLAQACRRCWKKVGDIRGRVRLIIS